jgi:hypothetical protein
MLGGPKFSRWRWGRLENKGLAIGTAPLPLLIYSAVQTSDEEMINS